MDGRTKETSTALSLDEQIANLKSLGLIIEDEKEAKRKNRNQCKMSHF